MFKITDVRCEYKVNPIGLGIPHPRISWKLESDQRGARQLAYQIVVSADEPGNEVLWDSGKVMSDASIQIELDSMACESGKRYYYRVRAWNEQEESTDWSDMAYWEMGLLSPQEWKGEWIQAPGVIAGFGAEQCPMLRRSFRIEGKVKSARIYATALGLYELKLNGRKVGDSYFNPGWTSYQERLQYQTYDVTNLLQTGENVIGAFLGTGWYKGHLAWEGLHSIYGDQLALLLQMHIELENGEQLTIVSDGEWKAAGSPILMSEIYHGETYDARLEQPGWTEAGFHDQGGWHQVQILAHSKDILVAQESDPVRIVNELKPVDLMKTPKGELVIDMGQNMVGWVRFEVEGEAGKEVMLQHAEVLDREGNFYIGNLRKAKQTVRYIMKGNGVEAYEPHFTFQGFRYVKLTGFDESKVRLEQFKGMVLHSDMERTGYFECSDPLINQLQHNIEWGLKGNFLDVPTDCPQRDERLGWTGDAQMFIRTAAYLHGTADFFTKWLRDLAVDQLDNGGVPFVIPNVLGKKGGEEFKDQHSSAAWGDAAVINPWTIYLVYGDKRLLSEQYDSMKAWVEYIRSQGENEFLWNTGFHFGDWLALDAKEDSYVGATDRDYIATAFYAYSVSLVLKAAEVLNKADDAVKYAELYRNVRKAFQDEFVTPSGRLAVGTQTAQVLALMFGLVEGPAKERATQKLIELLEENDYHLTTGFVGTPYLNFVLSDNGYNDIAYKLLFQQDYPSWLYQITKGATTIWEHWDGIKEDGTFWSDDMNSFNHYAYGAIGDWLYRVVAGIDLDETVPAYKRIVIKPQPGEGLHWADGRLESMYGMIRSAWHKLDDDKLRLDVTVPVNTTAEILLPAASSETQVTENGKPLGETEGIDKIEAAEQGIWITVGSGSYRFEMDQVK